ncbi:hypothetical protein IWW36_001725 [Coemansia brasiliensis]|uniref:Uncharacterized protein n=1 Tax=Coemansia brasiliensis TaxID=2650707 RepID=A0A9W8I8F0_9FUNG|nr:hypothetical protein IWW36_001725 [Coemansia brasiliensis]
MEFNELVGDILVLVYEYSSYESELSIDAWKRKLELLKVCSHWRQLLVSKVYGDIVVRIGVENNRRGRHWLMNNWNNGYPNVVFTNASLMTSNRMQHMARNIYIYPTCIYNHVYGIDEVVKVLGMYSHIWATINTISIHISQMRITENTPRFIFDTFGGLARDVTGEMLEMFPSAKRFCLTNKSCSFNGDYLFKKIAQSYSGQISQLVSDRGFTKNIAEFSAHLTHLDIPLMGKSTKYIPKIYAASLKYLRLCEVPQNYSWKCFAGTDASGSVCFPNLKALEVIYATRFNAPVAKRKCRHYRHPIKFFSLQRLGIEGRPGHCCILECSKFFGPLRDLRVAGPASNLKTLAESSMPQASNVTLAVDEKSGLADASLASMLNGICKKSNARATSIYAKRSDIFIDPSQLACFSLTSLAIHAPTDVRQLMVLTERFPCLERVGLRSVTFNHIPENALLVRSGAFIQQPLQPLDTRIRSMYLKFSCYGDLAQNANACMAYLLLRTSSLRQFAADAHVFSAIGDIIKDYSPFYRHLEDIEFLNVNFAWPDEF